MNIFILKGLRCGLVLVPGLPRPTIQASVKSLALLVCCVQPARCEWAGRHKYTARPGRGQSVAWQDRAGQTCAAAHGLYMACGRHRGMISIRTRDGLGGKMLVTPERGRSAPRGERAN